MNYDTPTLEESREYLEKNLSFCPFCRNRDESLLVPCHTIGGREIQMHCLECDAKGPKKPNKEEAFAAWNVV